MEMWFTTCATQGQAEEGVEWEARLSVALGVRQDIPIILHTMVRAFFFFFFFFLFLFLFFWIFNHFCFSPFDTSGQLEVSSAA